MATSFPGAVDTTNLVNPNTTDKTNSPSLAGQQANQNDAIKAVETKLGTGSSTPAVNTLLLGTGSGTSAWSQATSAQLAASLSDETGTGKAVFGTSPTLITPAVDTINESTPSNGVTVGGVNMKSGALTTANSIPTVALQALAVTGSKIASYSTSRRDNSSNSTETAAKIQSGWGAAQTGTGNGGTVNVTFPVAFTNIPIVVSSFGGDISGISTTLGAGAGNLKQCIAESLSVTTTSFILQILTRDGSNYASNSTVFGHWIAIGT